MHGIYMTAAMVLAVIIVYRFHRPLLARLARFDAKNVARKIEEYRDRRDGRAHYRHTLQLAAEQIDIITEITVADAKTGAPVKRYLFAGETFANRDEAELVRQDAIIAKAREFYVELPVALSRRGDGKLK